MAADELSVAGLLEKQISALERNLNRRLDTTERNVTQRFDAQDRALNEIKRQTTATNGRVTVLEQSRERAQGAMFAFRWVPWVASGAISTGFTVLILALTGGIH